MQLRLSLVALAALLLLVLLTGCGQAPTSLYTSTTSAPLVAQVPESTETPLPVVLQEEASATPTVYIPGMPGCCCPPDMVDATPSPDVTETPVPLDTPIATEPAASPTGVAPATGRIVAVDPGHGGIETGAVAASGLIEKNANLRIALHLASMLSVGGYVPVLTRSTDSRVNTAGKDLNGNGVVDTDDDLQARVDIANAAHADVLVSIHNDSSNDTSAHGTTTYYCDNRPFAVENERLAADLQRNLVAAIRSAGYNTTDHGTSDDKPLKKPFGHLFLLGPLTPRVARASSMPGALGETLYLSNPTEASLLADDAMLTAIARGYYEGIQAYFGGK